MSRTVRILLAILVPVVGIVAVAYLYIANNETWLHSRVQEVIARQAADTLTRQVRVGPVSGDLINSITVHGVAIGREGGLAEGAVVSADEITVRYSLLDIFTRKRAPAAAVDEVIVTGLLADVVRDPAGQVNLQKLIPPAKKIVPPEQRFSGKVRVSDSSVLYTDHSGIAGDDVLKLALTNVEGLLDMSRPDYLQGEFAADAGKEKFQHVEAKFGMQQGGPGLVLQGRVSAVNLAWARRFWPQPAVGIRRGTASVDVSVYRPPSEDAQTGFTVRGTVQSATASVPALRHLPVTVSGRFTATPQGVTTPGLDARMAGLRADIRGSLTNFQAPILDVDVRASTPAPLEVMRVLPGEVAQRIPRMEFDGPVTVEGTITGDPAHAEVDMQIQAPDNVSVWAHEDIPIHAQGVDLAVHLLDTSDPALLTDVSATSVSSETVPLAKMADIQWPDAVTVSPLENVSAEVRWANAEPGVRTDLSIASVNAGDMSVDDISASALLLGDVAQLKNIRLNALGGELTADAVIDTNADNPAGYIEGTIADMQVAGLSALPDGVLKLSDSAAGTIDATFAGSHRDSVTRSAASVTGTSLAWDDVNIEKAGLLAHQQDKEITVRSAYIADPVLDVWADGTATLADELSETKIDFNYRVADARLDGIARWFDESDVTGSAYLNGSIGGTVGEPLGTGHLIVFRPQYQRYDLAAAAAAIEFADDTLTVSELLATRETAAMSVSGSLSDLSNLAAAEDGGQKGPVPIDGRFELAGLDLRDISELLGEDAPDVSGLAEARGTFGGTVASPRASGLVHVVHALPASVDITEGRLPFELRDRVLTVNNARIEAKGSEVQGDGSLDFSNADNPILSAELSAADVHLEGLEFLQDIGLEAAGLVQIPTAHISGPMDDLTGELLITSETIQLGQEPIRDFRTLAVLHGDIVTLKEMHATVAGGDLSASGVYNRKTTELDGDVGLGNTHVPGLVSLGIPISRSNAVKFDTADEREQLIRGLESMALRLDGVLSAEVGVQGSLEALTAQASLDVVGGAVDGVSLPELKASASIDQKSIQDIQLDAHQGNALITAQGDIHFQDSINLLVEASGLDVKHYSPWLPLDTPVEGQLDFTVMATGRPSSPEVRGSIDIFNPGMAGIRFDVLNVPIVTLEEGALDIDTLVLKRQEQEVVVDGTVPFTWKRPGLTEGDPMEIQAKIEGLNLGVIPKIMQEAAEYRVKGTDEPPSTKWKQVQAEGTLATTVNLTGTVDEPELRGFLRVRDGRIAMTEETIPVEKIGVDIDFKSAVGSNIMQLKKVTAVCDNTVVEADGKVELNHVTLPKLHQNKYALNVTVASPEQALAGGWKVRDLGGTIELATVQEDLQRLTFNDVGGTFGDGSIVVDGFAEVNDFRLAQIAKNRFDMSVRADSARVKLAGLVDALLDGAIEIKGPGQKQASVKGAFTLDNGRFGIPMAAGGGGGKIYAVSSAYPSPDLDMRVKLGENMAVRDRGLVTPLKATDRLVHVHGTPQRPVVEGIIEAQAGRSQIPGGVADIRELGLQYRLAPSMGAFARDPLELTLGGNIWGVAETVLEDAALYGRPLGRVHITLTLTGRLPDSIDIRLASDPPLEQQHIYALLQSASLGYLVGDNQTGQISQVMSDTFTRALAAGFRTTVFQPIETQIRDALGLDQLQVTVAFDQPVEIKLGKYVMENLLVSYTSSVGEGAEAYELDVSYEIASKIRVTYHTDEDQEDRLQLERVWQF